MAATLTEVIYQFRFHSLNELDTSAKILVQGEPIVGKGVIDGVTRFKFKVGDGTTALLNLPYVKDMTFDEATTTTIDLGGIVKGEQLQGQQITTILKNLLTPYNPTVLDSISLDTSIIEVGTPFDGALVVTANMTDEDNLAAGNAAVLSSDPEIFTSVAKDPRLAMQVNGNSYVSENPIDISVSCSVQSTGGETSSKDSSLSYVAPMYYGAFQGKTTLVPNDLGNMTKISLTDISATYSFSSGRVFFAICNKIATPSTFVHMDRFTGQALLGMDMTYQGTIVKNNGYIDLTYKVFYSTYEFTTNVKVGI
ncbi:hypothetical protein LCGC14_0245330 [marine sediment metagenome]|uniref:Uncharacterized protein n=1 Tax=marine sediment metagenome TaxID=412755 RepID=A0A0F9UMA1_9ZZZZ